MSHSGSSSSRRGDKLAAMAQHWQQPSPTTEPSRGVAPPPRRDKLAAMRQAGAEAAAQLPPEEQQQELPSSSSSSSSPPPPETDEPASSARERQRDAVWEDLARAEQAVLHLLQVAEQTAQLLAQPHGPATEAAAAAAAAAAAEEEDDDDDDMMMIIIPERDPQRNTAHKRKRASQKPAVSRLSTKGTPPPRLTECWAEYQDTLLQIHQRLQPHAHLVQAYQPPARVHGMYWTRVEAHLAQVQQQWLQQVLQAEQRSEEVLSAQRPSAEP